MDYGNSTLLWHAACALNWFWFFQVCVGFEPISRSSLAIPWILRKLNINCFTAILMFDVMQVRLIGYCTKSSLFLVYQFIENGNLS